ncbi:MAG: O-methyltransferase [Flavobacteriales bacterium]|nr:O-methyltransferase [Flavobacteriales bacterium]MCB9191852.1 O-methyltransferase [Flavobacteriales bacterium]MCB9204727.1 O-methyltransferase [Flavobacteriales bacterium]
MDFIAKEIEAYAESFTREEGDVLAALNRETYAKIMTPRMLSGHLQGQVLRMFSQMIKPKNILEIGTYTGYSALCMVDGLQEGGKLITIDVNEELQDIIQRYVNEAGKSDKIDLRIGNAVEIIPNLDLQFDLVFIDADKENYPNYLDLVIDKVSVGGYIIADNVLWSGKVLEDDSDLDKDTIALKEYARKLKEDPRVETVLMPIRDGLLLARKLA